MLQYGWSVVSAGRCPTVALANDNNSLWLWTRGLILHSTDVECCTCKHGVKREEQVSSWETDPALRSVLATRLLLPSNRSETYVGSVEIRALLA